MAWDYKFLKAAEEDGESDRWNRLCVNTEPPLRSPGNSYYPVNVVDIADVHRARLVFKRHPQQFDMNDLRTVYAGDLGRLESHKLRPGNVDVSQGKGPCLLI